MNNLKHLSSIQNRGSLFTVYLSDKKQVRMNDLKICLTNFTVRLVTFLYFCSHSKISLQYVKASSVELENSGQVN